MTGARYQTARWPSATRPLAAGLLACSLAGTPSPVSAQRVSGMTPAGIAPGPARATLPRGGASAPGHDPHPPTRSAGIAPADSVGARRRVRGWYTLAGALVGAGASALFVTSRCNPRCGDDSAGPYLMIFVPAGALAGAVLGSAIGLDADRDRARARAATSGLAREQNPTAARSQEWRRTTPLTR